MALSAVSLENMDLCVHIKTLGAPPPHPTPPPTSPECCKSPGLPDSDRTLLGLLLQAICQQASPRARVQICTWLVEKRGEKP